MKRALTSTDVDISVLQETKLQDVSHFKALSFLPQSTQHFNFKPSIGASGGILTAWRHSSVEQISHSEDEYSITTLFSHQAMNVSFYVTNVYGPCEHAHKPLFLDSLSTIADSISGPWVILGDFNLLRDPSEKSNENFDATEADWFNSFINALGLQDIPLLDRLYTWSNNQASPTLCRLDRALVNLEWSQFFLDSVLSSSTRSTSDHVPIVLQASTSVPRSTTFRFNNHHLHHPDFPSLVIDSWSSVLEPADNSAALICKQIKRVRAVVKNGKKTEKKPSTIVKNCEIVINFLDLVEEHRNLSSLELRLRSLVKISLSHHTNVLATNWRQRGKIRDCVLGDDNTKYYQMCATIRLRKNQIRVLDPGDVPVYSHAGKAQILHKFYSDLLGHVSPVVSTPNLHASLSLRALDSFQSESLIAPFSNSEIKCALWGMKNDSSPGLDGFGPAFFKFFWSTISPSIFSLLQDFFELRSDLLPINQSHIVLLPKKVGVTKPEHYRPISLQNCPLKIISKALTNRLQPLIPFLVHPDQTGFLKGRSISENFVYAAELVQTCHKRKIPAVALKLDFRKAFDSIEWTALDRVLEAKNFCHTRF